MVTTNGMHHGNPARGISSSNAAGGFPMSGAEATNWFDQSDGGPPVGSSVASGQPVSSEQVYHNIGGRSVWDDVVLQAGGTVEESRRYYLQQTVVLPEGHANVNGATSCGNLTSMHHGGISSITVSSNLASDEPCAEPEPVVGVVYPDLNELVNQALHAYHHEHIQFVFDTMRWFDQDMLIRIVDLMRYSGSNDVHVSEIGIELGVEGEVLSSLINTLNLLRVVLPDFDNGQIFLRRKYYARVGRDSYPSSSRATYLNAGGFDFGFSLFFSWFGLKFGWSSIACFVAIQLNTIVIASESLFVVNETLELSAGNTDVVGRLAIEEIAVLIKYLEAKFELLRSKPCTSLRTCVSRSKQPYDSEQCATIGANKGCAWSFLDGCCHCAEGQFFSRFATNYCSTCSLSNIR